MAIYYVSTTGNDGNTGVTPAEAIRTFTRLNQLMQAGDIAYIAPGVYDVATYGKFNPINSAGTTDTTSMQIIGDTSGQAFGVPSGEVIIDATNNNYNLITLQATWTGRILFKNLKFKDIKITNNTQMGGLFYVPQNTNTVQLYLDNCVITNVQNGASGHVDGLVGYFYFSNGSSLLSLRGCTIGLGTTTNYYSSVFSLHSSLGAVDNHQVKILNTAIFHEEGVTINSPYHRVFNIGYHHSSSSYTVNGQMRILLKDSSIKPKSTDIYFKGFFAEYVRGGVSFDVEGCNINVNTMDTWISISTAKSFNIRRSVLKVNVFALPAFTALIAEHSKIIVGTYFKNEAGGASMSFEKCFLVNAPGANPYMVALLSSYSSFTAVDTVFSGFEYINLSSGNNKVFRRCLFVNCGSNQTNGGVNYALYYTTYGTYIADSTFLKLNPGTIAYVNSSGTDNTILTNVASNHWGAGGTTSWVWTTSNTWTIGTNVTERNTAPLPDVVVPEFDSPITGTQSALIPVACIGRGKFRVLLEGGRANTISLTLQKSWTGGKVEFWIENTKLNATVADVTTPQTVNITVTPDKSGVYELEIFGYDAVNQLAFTTNYQPNSIKVDTVIVA
jgi:hypothetical protein